MEETAYWLELLGQSGIMPKARLATLHTETEELIAIFVTIVKKVKQKSGR